MYRKPRTILLLAPLDKGPRQPLGGLGLPHHHHHHHHHLTSSWRGGREERGASPSPALPSIRSFPPQTQRRSCRGCLFAQCVSMFCAANHFSISNDECAWEDQRSAAGSQRKGLDWKCFERDSKKTSEIRTWIRSRSWQVGARRR